MEGGMSFLQFCIWNPQLEAFLNSAFVGTASQRFFILCAQVSATSILPTHDNVYTTHHQTKTLRNHREHPRTVESIKQGACGVEQPKAAHQACCEASRYCEADRLAYAQAFLRYAQGER